VAEIKRLPKRERGRQPDDFIRNPLSSPKKVKAMEKLLRTLEVGTIVGITATVPKPPDTELYPTMIQFRRTA
jgi:hypothetical protein